MLTPADVADELGVAVPNEAFDDLEASTPEWATRAAERVWSVAMGSDDARKLAREIMSPLLREAGRKLADQARAGQIAGAVGPLVATAVPIVGIAAAAVAYIAQAIAKASGAVTDQRDTLREGDRENLLVRDIGFRAGELHCFLGPWSSSTKHGDPFARRTYSWWLPAPGFEPLFETTPACYPAWNPYKVPGPHVPPKSRRDTSQVNDILVAAQLSAFSDPSTLVMLKPSTIATMGERARSTRAGDVMVFRDREGREKARRTATQEDVELWRLGVGTVAAARAALFRRPDLVRAAVMTRNGGTAPRQGAPADAVSVALEAPAAVGVSGALVDVLVEAAEAQRRDARNRRLLVGIAAVVGAGALLSRGST